MNAGICWGPEPGDPRVLWKPGASPASGPRVLGNRYGYWPGWWCLGQVTSGIGEYRQGILHERCLQAYFTSCRRYLHWWLRVSGTSGELRPQTTPRSPAPPPASRVTSEGSRYRPEPLVLGRVDPRPCSSAHVRAGTELTLADSTRPGAQNRPGLGQGQLFACSPWWWPGSDTAPVRPRMGHAPHPRSDLPRGGD